MDEVELSANSSHLIHLATTITPLRHFDAVPTYLFSRGQTTRISREWNTPNKTEQDLTDVATNLIRQKLQGS